MSLGESHDGTMRLNLHDSRLDRILKPNVRSTLLAIDAVGPIHLRGLARCLPYRSLKAVRNSVQSIKAARLIEAEAFKERELLKLVNSAHMPVDPVEEVPQPTFRAAFLDLSKYMIEICKRSVLVGNFAEGLGDLNQDAEVVVVVQPDLNLARRVESLVELCERIRAAYGIQVHYTILTDLDLIRFLVSRRGIWPSIFPKTVQGIVLTGDRIRHDGEALFDAVQNTLIYSKEKIGKLLLSGTLNRGERGLAFSDLGIKRYERLGKPPVVHKLNQIISLVGPQVSR